MSELNANFEANLQIFKLWLNLQSSSLKASSLASTFFLFNDVRLKGITWLVR